MNQDLFKEKVEINNNLFLTFSVKENINILKQNNFSYKILKNAFNKRKEVCFETSLFNSDYKVIVKFPYNFFSKLFLIDEITISNKKDDERQYNLKNSFAELEKIIECKYGLPTYCDGTNEKLFFEINDGYYLIHSLDEVRMGYLKHELIITKKINNMKKVAYLEFKDFFDFIQSLIPKDMKIEFFSYDKVDINILFSNDQEGYYLITEKESFKIVPLKINKYLDNNMTHIIHKQIKGKICTLKYKNIYEIKELISNYFDK